MALKRFVSRRGTPNLIVSDNAPQFKVTKNAIDIVWDQIMKDPTVNSYISSNRIQWSFIKELSPWMGGFYERLVGTTKMALKKSIGRLRLTSLQLQTTLTEIEAILNSRPLVYVGDEIDDKDILTPQHFLSLKKDHGLPVVGDIDENLDDPIFLPKKDSASALLETWKKGNQHLNQFWNIWKEQYLTSLRERSQIFMKHSHIQDSKEARVGDIVQIKENTPRGTWKIGKIIELIKSQDNIIRAAKVMTRNKTILQRSLVHLYPLECNDESNNNNHNKHDVKTDQQDQLENSSTKEDQRANIIQRPKRKAAQTARDRIIAQEIQYE